jgi:ribosomal protein S18 acetylase RimI-like enzyme
MIGPLHQLDPTEVQLALAHDEQKFLAMFSSHPSAEVSTDPSVDWIIGGNPLGLFNNVYRTQFDSADADPRIDAVLARFLARGAQRLVWTVPPGDEPASLGVRLEAHHGLLHVRDEMLMAVDLNAIPAVDFGVGGLQIEQVTTEPALREWVYVDGFAFDPPWQAEARAVNFGWYRHVVLERRAPIDLLIGRINDQPVCTSAMFAGAGFASIHDVVTAPEWRSRGFATAITAAALSAGRSRGQQIGALTSEQTGPNLYVNLGFRTFGTLARYRWTRERARAAILQHQTGR